MKVKIKVKVVPNASSSEVVGWLGDALKVRTTSAPEKGRANVAVEAILTEALGLSVGAVKIKSGQSSMLKLFEVTGLSMTEIRQIIPV